ncbi:PF20097 family protein [Crassaminicella profunda]|uniref:PF20097 family protein n=1 Tax=Crassaminicella profunda TaxID=1286698 RepID=UPI001CA7AB19|nr:PF20097 family protein [Crassaminicella profunda]QZY53785.1 PF20097 family protein [Crassaminicella profunda]
MPLEQNKIKENEKESKCPYCNNRLVSGFIYGSHYPLTWLPESKKLFLGMAMGGESIGTFKGRPRVKGYRCEQCNKIIVNLNEE